MFLSPLLPGGPGEGPDCHFPKEIYDLWADFGPESGADLFQILNSTVSTRPHEFRWSGDIDGPEHYRFIRFRWAATYPPTLA